MNAPLCVDWRSAATRRAASAARAEQAGGSPPLGGRGKGRGGALTAFVNPPANQSAPNADTQARAAMARACDTVRPATPASLVTVGILSPLAQLRFNGKSVKEKLQSISACAGHYARPSSGNGENKRLIVVIPNGEGRGVPCRVVKPNEK